MRDPAKRKIDCTLAPEDLRRQAMEYSGTGLYCCNSNGIIVSIDKVAMQILAGDKYGDPTKLTDKHISKLFSDTENQEVFGSRLSRDFEYCFTVDDQQRWVLIDSYVVIIDDDRTLQFIIRDITAQKKEEQEEHRLHLANIAGNVAHDFNNLLVAIVDNMELIMAELPTASPVQEFATDAKKAADKANELCQRIMLFTGRQNTQRQVYDLNKLIEESAPELEQSLPPNVKIVYRPAPDLPMIHIDREQIALVLMSLVINGAEAIENKSGRITIATGQTDDGTAGSVFLQVSDTGCGMAPATISKAFDPFFSTKFFGRGMDLAAAMSIVEKHDGTMDIFSQPDKGTVFRAMFPLCSQGSITDLPHSKSEQHTLDYNKEHRCKTVLIVDDEPLVLSTTNRILKRAGFNVFNANSGAEGVEIFNDHKDQIDVVLLDLLMPEMDGTMVFKELSNIRSDIKVVFTSGYILETIDSEVTANAAGFISKPYRPTELIEKIDEVLSTD